MIHIIGKKVFKILFGIPYRLQVNGAELLPRVGGGIIASNHLSVFDPPLHGSIINRELYFMAKKELFNIPILGCLITKLNAFPVERTHIVNIEAIKKAISILKNGDLLLIFPEGKRTKKLTTIKYGIGFLSCITQVPLIPAKIINTDQMIKFKKIKVIYGKPIIPPKKFTKKDYILLSQKVYNVIKHI
ncbi:MAG: 1-acyl-sn-glycerol-3-phosphate acyltransferase [Endomicrobium sp.]|nr:1-acyl-sn-glycerol-3-phosphate acyltransferase [Endomicrobium sp.]